MKQGTVQTFIVVAIIIMFGFMAWTIWHHHYDRHCQDVYRIQGPGWEYEYRKYNDDYHDRHNRHSNYLHRNEDCYNRDGNFRIGPLIEWESKRRYNK